MEFEFVAVPPPTSCRPPAYLALENLCVADGSVVRIELLDEGPMKASEAPCSCCRCFGACSGGVSEKDGRRWRKAAPPQRSVGLQALRRRSHVEPAATHGAGQLSLVQSTLNPRPNTIENRCSPWAKPPKNQQDVKPALAYEPGGRTFESCRAHHPNSVGTVTPRRI